MQKITDTAISIDDIMGGAALSITGQYIVDWSGHDSNYAIRTSGSIKNPKGGIVFITNSEFQRITQQQNIFWISACMDVEDFLDRFQ